MAQARCPGAGTQGKNLRFVNECVGERTIQALLG
jgi:hypothetical protein